MTQTPAMRRLSLLGGIGAAAILAAACSGGASPTPVPASAAPPSASAPASAEASPSASAEASGSGEAYQVTVVTDAKLGKILTGEDGKTLYVFKNDSAGKSTCNTGCVDNWPPFTLEDGETVTAGDGVTGTLGSITRDDGTKQVAYNNVALYYFAGDQKAGDTNGQGVGGKWFAATP